MSAARVRLSLPQSSTTLQAYGRSIHGAWLQMTRRAPRKGLKASAIIDDVKNCAISGLRTTRFPELGPT